MNGANLLWLLEKHGQHARIDINEARKLNGSIDDQNKMNKTEFRQTCCNS